MRTKPRQERSIALTDAVVQAAAELIGRGEEPLTTKAVAARAGVGIGSLYRYFEDLEAIIDEVANRFAAALDASVAELVDELNGLSWAEMSLRAVDWVSSTTDLIAPGLGGALNAMRAQGRAMPAIDRVERRIEDHAVRLYTDRIPHGEMAARLVARGMIGIARSTLATDVDQIRSPVLRATLERLLSASEQVPAEVARPGEDETF